MGKDPKGETKCSLSLLVCFPTQCSPLLSSFAAVQIKNFDPKKYDFGKKKAFPMRPGHFFTGVSKAMKDLEWEPQYNLMDGLRDSYENDFVHKKAAGGLKNDFECDDMVLENKVLA
jgi:hypothetical protein